MPPKVQAALRLAEARFAGFIDLSEDAIISVDKLQRVTLFNKGAERIFGYRASEVLGRPVDILIPARFASVHRQYVGAFAGSGDALRPMNERGAIFGVRKDGSEFPAEASISKFEVGAEKVLTVRLRDITEARRAAEALRKSEATLRAILESASQGVVVIDERGAIRLVNAKTEEMFGYRREDLIGASLEVLLPERFRRKHEADRTQYFLHPRARPMGLGVDLSARRRDGAEFPVEISLSYVHSEDGTIALGFITDITERKRTEAQVQESLVEKEVLLKEIHHRVKNNLQVICSLLSLQADPSTDPRVAQILRDSENRVKSMALIHQKLYQSPDLARVNFAGYVESLAQSLLYSFAIDPERIRLELNIDVKLGIDQAIPCGLMINELLSNAFKHAFPDGRRGRVTLDFRAAGDTCRLTVRDDGVGLPPGFDAERTDTLGLRLLHGLAAQLGGAVQSLPGPGTAFELTFALEG